MTPEERLEILTIKVLESKDFSAVCTPHTEIYRFDEFSIIEVVCP